MDGAGDLERWAADARAREAADARVRERWLRAQAEEDSSLAGVLLALAERRETVVVTTVAGRRHRGVVAGVGVDFAALQAPAGTTTLVALAALGDVRVAEGGRRSATTGEGTVELGVRLGEVLAQAAGQRPRISVQAGAAAVVGDLRAVGGDVLTVRADGEAGAVELGVRLGEVLAQAAGQRPRISVQAGAVVVVGDLRAVGGDVITVRADGEAGAVYVPLASISEVSFLASG